MVNVIERAQILLNNTTASTACRASLGGRVSLPSFKFATRLGSKGQRPSCLLYSQSSICDKSLLGLWGSTIKQKTRITSRADDRKLI